MQQFYCPKYPNISIRYIPGASEYYYDETGRKILKEHPDIYIHFKNGIFETEDEKIIKFLENHYCMTGINHIGESAEIFVTKGQAVSREQIQLWQQLQSMSAQEALVRLNSTQYQQAQQYGNQPGYDPVTHTAMVQQQVEQTQ